MSCQDCEEFQETSMTSYYRWKNANIEVRGCQQHLREVFEALNDAQDKLRKGGEKHGSKTS